MSRDFAKEEKRRGRPRKHEGAEQNFAQWLQGFMDGSGRDVAWIAEQTGVAVKTVYAWLDGSQDPSADKAIRLALIVKVREEAATSPPGSRIVAPAALENPELVELVEQIRWVLEKGHGPSPERESLPRPPEPRSGSPQAAPGGAAWQGQSP